MRNAAFVPISFEVPEMTTELIKTVQSERFLNADSTRVVILE